MKISPLSDQSHPWWKRESRFLDSTLDTPSRLLILIVSVVIGASALLPLWRITLIAPQYQEGLRLTIYSYQLKGGNGGQDLHEINNLNHYIGMQPLERSDFIEMDWFPFVLGILALIGLRTVVHGRMHQVLDLLALFTYFALFSGVLFYHRMYTYGHQLDPKAPMTIEPFTPVILGKNQIANFTQWSLPHIGGWLLVLVPLLLLWVMWRNPRNAG